ncbi:MAG: proton-conducting transporter membrane subunit [Desulfurococcaceae archaeon]
MELAMQMLGLLTPVLIIHAFVIPILKLLKSTRLPGVIALMGSGFAVVATSIIFYGVQEGGPMVYTYGGWPPHFGIVYEVDYYNALLGFLTAWIMLVIVIYSMWYEHHIDDPSWYYVLLIGLETGILGCLYTGDAFNLFVMLEVLGITAYGLVAYHRDRAEAVEAAAKYALIGAVATSLYFTAVVLLYAGYGSVNMAVLSIYSRTYVAKVSAAFKYLSLLSVALALWVFTYKSALVPNHFWLPDAHPEAPTPVSAALSGLVVNVGVYATARFLYTIFGPDSTIASYREVVLLVVFILGAISGIIGALMMMAQRDIKRLLAYSTVCHIGIAYMGISAGFIIGNEEAIRLAVMGGIVHIVAHGIAKALLFMSSGVLIDAAGSRDLDEMKGIGRYHPLTSISMILGFFSLAGLIPFIGFYSKLLIALGYINSGFILGAVLIIVISALSIPGYLKAISAVVFSTGREPRQRLEKTWIEPILFAMALSLLVLGVLFQYLWPVYDEASKALVTIDGVIGYISRAWNLIPVELKLFMGVTP